MMSMQKLQEHVLARISRLLMQGRYLHSLTQEQATSCSYRRLILITTSQSPLILVIPQKQLMGILRSSVKELIKHYLVDGKKKQLTYTERVCFDTSPHPHTHPDTRQLSFLRRSNCWFPHTTLILISFQSAFLLNFVSLLRRLTI